MTNEKTTESMLAGLDVLAKFDERDPPTIVQKVDDDLLVFIGKLEHKLDETPAEDASAEIQTIEAQIADEPTPTKKTAFNPKAGQHNFPAAVKAWVLGTVKPLVAREGCANGRCRESKMHGLVVVGETIYNLCKFDFDAASRAQTELRKEKGERDLPFRVFSKRADAESYLARRKREEELWQEALRDFRQGMNLVEDKPCAVENCEVTETRGALEVEGKLHKLCHRHTGAGLKVKVEMSREGAKPTWYIHRDGKEAAHREEQGKDAAPIQRPKGSTRSERARKIVTATVTEPVLATEPSAEQTERPPSAPAALKQSSLMATVLEGLLKKDPAKLTPGERTLIERSGRASPAS